jgi:hypothetical protein
LAFNRFCGHKEDAVNTTIDDVEDEDFEAKIQENKDLTTLFTDSELVMFWKFLSWVRKLLFCIEIHNIN